jgi:glycosyltransferase involved in cell wall biosynthesis
MSGLPLVLIAGVMLLGFATPMVVYWSIVLVRLRRGLIDRPTVRAGIDLPPPPGGWPRLSVIVPAHNEERVIDRCISSLRSQDYENLEIVLVLDRCTDGTLEIARRHAAEDPRVRVIENEHCPEDWAGKCNAARCGAVAASGRFLLFTDADTEFDPRLCRAAVAMAEHRQADMVTLLSTLTALRPFERIAQPVACFVLLHIYPVKRAHGSKRPRAFANGQFMLFRRDWYDSVGGHEAVHQDLLEDLAFARKLRRTDGTAEVLLADDMLRCSMYDSMGTFLEGWRRIFTDVCGRRPRRLRKYGWRVVGVGAALPLSQIVSLAAALLAIADGAWWIGTPLAVAILLAVALQTLTLHAIYRAVGAPGWAVALFPAGCVIVGQAMLRGGRDLRQRRPISWGGRQYILEPRMESGSPWVLSVVPTAEGDA